MGSRVLLVEGPNDQHALWALFKAHGISDSIKVERPSQKENSGGLKPADGIAELLKSIPVRLKASDLERFGVILDADENIQARWEQLKGRLAAAGCTMIPDQPQPGGTIIQLDDGPKVGAWIMPNNSVPGMLESFLAFLIPTTDKLLPLVDQFLENIPDENRLYSTNHHPKARIHAWLAVQAEPGKPLGQAITATYLDAKQSVVEPFLAWINTLFVI